MLARRRKLKPKPRTTQEHPQAKDDERHDRNKHRKYAKIPEQGAQSRQAIGRIDSSLAAVDRLHRKIRAAETQAGQSQAGDDRVGAQPLDHEPE